MNHFLDGTVTEFYCGGTLINDQYILTGEEDSDSFLFFNCFK